MNRPSKSSSAPSAPVRLRWPMFLAGACVACLIQLAAPQTTLAQLAPGPYEILPYDDGFIIEAFNNVPTSVLPLTENVYVAIRPVFVSYVKLSLSADPKVTFVSAP